MTNNRKVRVALTMDEANVLATWSMLGEDHSSSINPLEYAAGARARAKLLRAINEESDRRALAQPAAEA